MKPKKKLERSGKEHKEVQGETGEGIVRNEELFFCGGGFGIKINLLFVDKGLVCPVSFSSELKLEL